MQHPPALSRELRNYIRETPHTCRLRLTSCPLSCMLHAPGQARRGRTLQTPPGSKDSNGKVVSRGAAGHLPGCFPPGFPLSIRIPLWHNSCMPRWPVALGIGILGVALGLLYGWIIDPIKFIDTPPSSLRADYRADYVLTIAESYDATKDADFARRQLAILGSDAPAIICARSIQTARQVGYSSEDQALMQELMLAMQAAVPAPTARGTLP